MEPEKKEEEKIETPVNDEAELDKVLEDSINEVKAGKELAPKKEEVKVEEKKEETPETPKSEDPSEPPTDEENQKPVEEFKLPIPGKPSKRGKFESDEVYEKRAELMDLVTRRKNAVSDEQRQKLSEQIKVGKKELATLGMKDNLTNPLNQKSGVEDDKKAEVEDEATKADRERLRQLGGATKEDIQAIVQQERLAVEVKNTLEKFVDRHAELKDIDTREVFFDFVDSNYNWQNKSGKELMTVLELARESMFKPSETIQERVLKGADVQNKVNAMQFPGGTIAKQDYSPEMKSSINELVATGMSEEKAIELLSD
jgi:hypothetical protein